MDSQKITNFVMHDGSRHFVSLPEVKEPPAMFWHIFRLGFAFPYFYLSNAMESWIDFWYKGYRFTINNQYGEYWFFVKNPLCPEKILNDVAAHFSKILS